jgi:hypothetical protein
MLGFASPATGKSKGAKVPPPGRRENGWSNPGRKFALTHVGDFADCGPAELQLNPGAVSRQTQAFRARYESDAR